MSQEKTASRIWSIDLLRGIFILTMLLAHSIFFFHAKTHPLLQLLNTVGDFISFTGIVLASGAAGYVAYIHYHHPHQDVVKRILKRLAVYLLAYYLLAIFASGITEGWSIYSALRILTFQKLVPFTEFIVTLILFGLLKIPLRPVYDKMARSNLALFLAAIIAYALGVLGESLNLSPLPTAWKVIIFGEPGHITFSLFHYLPVYLLGIFAGRQFWIRESDKKLARSFLKLAVFSLLLVAVLSVFSINQNLPISSMFTRWPPGLGFILIGSTIVLFTLSIFVYLHELKNLPMTRTLLLILGQNTFSIYFSHTFLLYLFKGMEFPQAHSAILTGSLTLLSIIFALYLAKILPLNYCFTLNFINWCECKFGYCSHADEHHAVLKIKQYLFKIINLFEVFSFRIGGRRIRLLNTRSTLLAFSFLVLFAVPLGIAENELYFERTISSLSGRVNRQWFLNNEKFQTLTYQITIPNEILTGQKDIRVYYDVDGGSLITMDKKDSYWEAKFDLLDFNLGNHQIITVVDIGGRKYKTMPVPFFISAPLYVTWTIDWEGYDVNAGYLEAMSQIADSHDIPMTHLFNPFIYVSDGLEPARVRELTDWVSKRKLLNNEEIGLHLHMFPEFIKEAGVEPKLEPVWGGGFTEGYDILTTAYNYEEMKIILNFAKKLLEDNNLGTPRSYRAGAWFADSQTLKALDNTGFFVDTSGRTKYNFGTNNISGPWYLKTTSQPYYPSAVNQNSDSPPPVLNILEIPNNGADSYAYNSTEMIDRFKDNYSGGVLENKKQVTYLSHPHWFNSQRQKYMQEVFNYIDQYSFKDDHGPLIYTTLMGVYQAWQSQ